MTATRTPIRESGSAALHRLRRADTERRFRGLLPHRLLRWRRPLWWQEIAIIALGYWLYGVVRNAIPGQTSVAVAHGRDIALLQDVLHLNWELSLNHVVAAHSAIAHAMDYYYATLHFIVTPVVMVWLFIRRAPLYRSTRTVLVTTTLVSLLGFYLYPTAPPRLLPGAGYIDTVVRFRTWGSLADPEIAKHSNQFAAMPSLHMAWALWCGVTVVVCARYRIVKILGVAYPAGTFLVIVGTANHYILDALGGAVVLAVGFGIQYLLSGHGAFVAPVDAPDVPHLAPAEAAAPVAAAAPAAVPVAAATSVDPSVRAPGDADAPAATDPQP